MQTLIVWEYFSINLIFTWFVLQNYGGWSCWEILDNVGGGVTVTYNSLFTHAIFFLCIVNPLGNKSFSLKVNLINQNFYCKHGFLFQNSKMDSVGRISIQQADDDDGSILHSGHLMMHVLSFQHCFRMQIHVSLLMECTLIIVFDDFL